VPKKIFHHVGPRAFEPQPDENYLAPSDCRVTNPIHSPYRIEFLRDGENGAISKESRGAPHIAGVGDHLDDHLEGKELYLAPFDVDDPPFAHDAYTREDRLFAECIQFYPDYRSHVVR